MATGIGYFPGRPFQLRLEIWYNWQSGSTASVHTEVWIDKLSYSPSWSGCCASYEVYLDSVGRIGAWSGGFDFINGNNFLIYASDNMAVTNINGDLAAHAYATYDPGILGYTEAHAAYDGVNLSPPCAPTPVGLDEVTVDSMRYRFNGNCDGGSPITGWAFEWANNAAFTGATLVSSGGTSTVTGLSPGTTYYFRSRGQNAIGVGAWSSVISQSTLPAVAPGLTVAASPSGAAATLTFTPPGGYTGVTKYTWERRLTGTTTPVATGETPLTTATVIGLTPGTRYDWRGSAWFGTYQSPWTTWQALTQPKPNVDAGDFFDGASPDVADLDYAWAGAANASISTATARVPEGWEASYATGGAGALLQVTAGLFSEFAARVQVTKDATVAGCRFGQHASALYWSDVTGNAPYVGSIYAKLSRTNSVTAEITWLTAAGAVISRSPGTAVQVGTTWTRLLVTDTAPATAEHAVVRLIDIAGTGWSVFRGGDIVTLDAAMITLNEQFPYFDGNTLFDGTYVYEWEGLPNASTSTRTPMDQVDLDVMVFGDETLVMSAGGSLTDPDCAPVPVPPRPPTIPSDCIEEVGLWRRYYLQLPAAEISDWLDVVPTIEITTGSSAARQVRVRYYPNPGALTPDEVDVSTWISEQIISYMPPLTTITLDGLQQRAYAEVGTASALSADHLLYGTSGRPATWPVLSCGIDYLVSLEVPTGEPVGNITVGAALTVRT